MSAILSGDRRRSSEDIRARAARAAAGFEALGIGRGDTVALFLRNDFPFLEASLGAGMIGAYPVPVNWHYTGEEARHIFTDSDARLIVIHADMLAGVRAVLPEGAKVIVVKTPPELAAAYGAAPADCDATAGFLEWESWLATCPVAPKTVAEAPGTIIYTSGTTGKPKGVRRNAPTPEQVALFAKIRARQFGFAPHLDDPSRITTAITGPMYHSAPNAYGLFATRVGANVILQPRFDPEELLQMIERHRITHLHMVPIMFNRLLKLPDAVKRKYDLSSLEFVVHAAAPISPAIKRAMIEWWGPVITEYYGSTETSVVTFCDTAEWLAHPGTVGRPIPECTLRVVDAQGNDVPRGTIGEVIARIEGVADFRYHGEAAAQRPPQHGGLIAPGDIGYLDEDGFLFLRDRSKDMLISGGVNIYPAEIEAELHRMPGLADCAAFGIPDEEYGEAVCAVIQPQPGVVMTESDVRAFLDGRLARYKIPRRIEFRSDLPREDSGKIFKRKLREPYWEGVQRKI
jgi:long-chain acyl-CoA synthetase